MPIPTPPAALSKHLADFTASLTSARAAAAAPMFFAPNADFLGAKGIVRGADKVQAAVADFAKVRGNAEVAHVKQLEKGLYLIDTTRETPDGKAWFTEVWQSAPGGKFVIQLTRARSGSPKPAFNALNKTEVSTFTDTMSAGDRQTEERALRQGFKAFRSAFNNGDTEGMAALWTPKCDAIPVFSFIGGRAQVLVGRPAIGAKGDRMQNVASNPAPDRSAVRGAAIVDGEPKSIRFLSATLAAVDGTAQIGNIPAGHGFAPKEMSGVYTDIWRKVGQSWQIESSRAWF
jgi:ketosteroid isomerase-like protein